MGMDPEERKANVKSQHYIKRWEDTKNAAKIEFSYTDISCLFELPPEQCSYEVAAQKKEYGNAETARNNIFKSSVSQEYQHDSHCTDSIKRIYIESIFLGHYLNF